MNIGFIGIGSMGGAIAQRLLAELSTPAAYSSILKHAEVFISSKSGTSAKDFCERHGGTPVPVATAGNCDVVILAVKPQQVKEVTPLISKEALVISIAAGVRLQELTRALSPRVIRAMPNIGASIGLSATALAAPTGITASELNLAHAIFATVGTTQLIDEAQFPAFTAVASCALAWNCEYLEGLARGAVQEGMRKTDAVRAAAAAFEATAKLLLEQPENLVSPALLLERVCSPGGTTIAGLNTAVEAGLGTAATAAVRAACARDRELNQ